MIIIRWASFMATILWMQALLHRCASLKVKHFHIYKSPRCADLNGRTRASTFPHLKPTRALHASSGKSYENLVYSPPKYIINAIRKQPDRQRWEPAHVVQLTGAEIRRVERDLLALAILTGAKMEVNHAGNILYTFPRQLDRILIQRSIRHRINTAVAKILPTLAYIYRASFGLMLISSIAIVYMALIVALASIASSSHGNGSSSSGSSRRKSHRRSRDEDDEDDDDFSSARSRRRSRQNYPRSNFVITFDFFDMLRLFYRPTIHYQQLHQRHQHLPFLAAVHSFLFGDGDPNQKHDVEHLYPAAVQYIQRQRGYVTAEELALFLPKVPTISGSNGVVVSESYVLPFLLRYGGKPILVDDAIVYHFPDLVVMNDMGRTSTPPQVASLVKAAPLDRPDSTVIEQELEPLLEIVPEFSRSTWSQRVNTMFLAGVNLAGVLALRGLLRDHRSLKALPSDFWRTIRSLLPILYAYSTAFIVTPIVRWLFYVRGVQNILERNRLRRQWFNLLRTPTTDLWRKLQARQQLQLRDSTQGAGAGAYTDDVSPSDHTGSNDPSVDSPRVVFDSSRPVNEQSWKAWNYI